MAGSQRVVALSIGTANIVAVQGLVGSAPQGERTAIVEKVAVMRTPSGAVRSNGIHAPEALTEALKELWRANSFQTRNVIVGVDSRRLQSGVSWIDGYHPDDLRAIMTPDWVNTNGIIQQKVDVKNSTIDYFVLRERTTLAPLGGEASKQILVCVIDTPKGEPQALANVVEDAGLEMVGMDLNSLGMLRAMSLSQREDKRVVDMLVDIGDTFTSMVLHNNGNIRAIKTVTGSAGSDVTRELHDKIRRLGNDVAGAGTDAEVAKVTLSLALAERRDDAVTRLANEAAAGYVSRLWRDLDQFVSTYLASVNEISSGGTSGTEERGLASITLCGGGSALHGVAERLSGTEGGGVNIPVRRGAVSQAYVNVDGTRVASFEKGVSVISTVGLLTADRRAV